MKGQASLGEHHVVAGYFEQNQAEALDLAQDRHRHLLSRPSPTGPRPRCDPCWGISAQQRGRVQGGGQLSGGEKARLALALMLVRPCNLLVLDEPTNHLDIPAKQMLEEALKAYEGAALLVSHDRYFIARVANRIVELRDGELVLYRGDYAYYLEKKAGRGRREATA
jgi:ATP-binding cassette subfamily F protein 3